MTDVICPCCARPVAPGELQRGAGVPGAPGVPSRADLEGAIEVIAAAARAGLLGRHAHHFIGVLRLDLAGVMA